jgi:hypothetical protein
LPKQAGMIALTFLQFSDRIAVPDGGRIIVASVKIQR